MEEQLAYLKAVVEGADDIRPWRAWFEGNADILAAHLTPGQFLRLKLRRIEAIPEILASYNIAFSPSDRYGWLAGRPGACRDCGAEVQRRGPFVWCPQGCFRLHGLSRPRSHKATGLIDGEIS